MSVAPASKSASVKISVPSSSISNVLSSGTGASFIGRTVRSIALLMVSWPSLISNVRSSSPLKSAEGTTVKVPSPLS